MASSAPASSQAAKRALRKRKLHAALESGSASFGSASLVSVWRPNAQDKQPKHLGRQLTEAERAENMLGTPWPMSRGDSGEFWETLAKSMEGYAKIDIKHSKFSPTG